MTHWFREKGPFLPHRFFHFSRARRQWLRGGKFFVPFDVGYRFSRFFESAFRCDVLCWCYLFSDDLVWELLLTLLCSDREWYLGLAQLGDLFIVLQPFLHVAFRPFGLVGIVTALIWTWALFADRRRTVNGFSVRVRFDLTKELLG